MLPCPEGFFNNNTARSQLQVVHVKTDNRHLLLDQFAELQNTVSKSETPDHSMMILLENRFEKEQFVYLAESKRGKRSRSLYKEESATLFVQKAQQHADVAHLSFGTPMWPADWNMVQPQDMSDFPLA